MQAWGGMVHSCTVDERVKVTVEVPLRFLKQRLETLWVCSAGVSLVSRATV